MNHKRRKQPPPEVMAEHPPQQCRKFMSARVLKLLDEIAAKQQRNREGRP